MNLQWDIQTNGFVVQELAHITNGHAPSDFVSLLQANVSWWFRLAFGTSKIYLIKIDNLTTFLVNDIVVCKFQRKNQDHSSRGLHWLYRIIHGVCSYWNWYPEFSLEWLQSRLWYHTALWLCHSSWWAWAEWWVCNWCCIWRVFMHICISHIDWRKYNRAASWHSNLFVQFYEVHNWKNPSCNDACEHLIAKSKQIKHFILIRINLHNT